MEAIKTKSVVGQDQHLRIDLEVALPPGPVEVVMVVSAEAESVQVEVDPETARQRFLAARVLRRSTALPVGAPRWARRP